MARLTAATSSAAAVMMVLAGGGSACGETEEAGIGSAGGPAARGVCATVGFADGLRVLLSLVCLADLVLGLACALASNLIFLSALTSGFAVGLDAGLAATFLVSAFLALALAFSAA